MVIKKICFIGFVVVVFSVLVFYCLFQKEPFQSPHNDIVSILDNFCNHHYGYDWGIDNIYPYNEKIIFATIQARGSTIDLSIQPSNRAIIIENINGGAPLKRRVYRY